MKQMFFFNNIILGLRKNRFWETVKTMIRLLLLDPKEQSGKFAIQSAFLEALLLGLSFLLVFTVKKDMSKY